MFVGPDYRASAAREYPGEYRKRKGQIGFLEIAEVCRPIDDGGTNGGFPPKRSFDKAAGLSQPHVIEPWDGVVQYLRADARTESQPCGA